MEKNEEIKEYYVSYETAKIAKEHGFDEKTEKYYDSEKHILTDVPTDMKAPSLEILAQWIRKRMNIFIHIYLGDKDNYQCELNFPYKSHLSKYTPNMYYIKHENDNCEQKMMFPSYEDALEAGLLDTFKTYDYLENIK